jgi:hypothetical protein
MSRENVELALGFLDAWNRGDREGWLAAGTGLRGLLAVLARQVEALAEDIEQLYEDWFIETADGWVPSSIGDLLPAPAAKRRLVLGSLLLLVVGLLCFRRRRSASPRAGGAKAAGPSE